MEYHKYSLAKKGKSICPKCGKKTFVLYLDNTTGNPLHSTVGKCDRSDNCSYHYSPKQYFTDNHISFDNKKECAPRPVIIAKPKPSFIDEALFKKSLTNYEQNNFAKWLAGIVGDEVAKKAIERYFVGTSKNGTVFWQIDLQGKARAGKIIVYDRDGRRRKDVMPPVQWVHSILKLPDFNLSQCLFGEHLLSDKHKTAVVVESEKSAIIGSIYLPDMIWLACGGSEGLSTEKCAVLKGRNIMLFPDCGVYDKWSLKAKELSKICNVAVSSLIERNATDEEREAGFDLADYLIRCSPPKPEETKLRPAEVLPVKQTISNPVKTPYHTTSIKKDDWSSEISDIEAWLSEATLPATPFKLSVCETINDCQLFLMVHLLTAKTNNGNPTFRPYLDRVINFKNKVSI